MDITSRRVERDFVEAYAVGTIVEVLAELAVSARNDEECVTATMGAQHTGQWQTGVVQYSRVH